MRTVAFVVCAAALVSNTAAAEPCQTASGASIDEAEARDRARELYAAVDRNRGHMRTWSIVWLSLYSAAAAGQGALAVALDDDDEQAIYGVGSARAAIAAAAVPLLGVKTRAFALTGDACADLARAEEVIRDNARSHAKGRGLIKHAGVVGLNLAALLTLGLGFDLWERGAIGAGIGLVVGEIQIYTQPMGSRDVLRAYESRTAAGAATSWMVAPSLGRDHAGLAIVGAW